MDFWSGIDLDPCSNVDSIVPAETKFILPEQDGLKIDWGRNNRVYVNPPFGRNEDGTSIYNWLQKCYNSWQNIENCCEILALIPVATNTKHWKDFIFSCDSKICFLNDTRLKFRIGNDSDAENNKGISIACAMIYWGENKNEFESVFSKYGNIR